MRSQEIQTTRIESNERSIDNKFNSTNERKENNSELIEQIEVDKSLPSQAALNPLVRNGLIISILALLFVASIYYGVINP
ncbi:hypothetical protein [Scytonema sp. NUACC26]|uniref:hypothetical protein n=1 Tax=Scytonema sp. NUACC26 TaxID=3140176 RepID=UPI0034DC2D8F